MKDMTLPTHILLGAILGKVTGNYPVAILSSTVVDLDHMYSYAKHGILKNPKLFWKTVIDQKDAEGDQRGMLHNILVCIFISLIFIFLFPKIGYIICLGWLGHLVLDALDNSDYWPLYPNKSVNLRGPIIYCSFHELLFSFLLVIVYFVI